MIPILFDYETLRVVWWLLLGVLLIESAGAKTVGSRPK